MAQGGDLLVGRAASAERREPPWLESGDRLSRAEFEHRHTSMPAHIKAELVGGVAYVASPTRTQHGRPHAHLIGWLVAYAAETGGVEVLDDTTLRLSEEDQPKPDAVLRVAPAAGGASSDDADGYVVGAPEWIGEVALSSESIDLGQKLQAYQRAGCLEYAVVVLHSREVRWFALDDAGVYRPLAPDADGVLRSSVFPGLWLDATALLEGRMRRVFEVLRAGLASEEHAAFVRALKDPT